MSVVSIPQVPKAFIWRRLHSLMGLWFVLFLIEHLLTNSQAALWLGDNGKGFVRMVNALHNLPYLQVIEITLLGVPILIHLVLGIKYLLTSKFNVIKGDGSKPYLPHNRNYAYTFQRITSWILIVGLIFHVIKFRFLEYPESLQIKGNTFYLVKLDADPGLGSVAERLNVSLFDRESISKTLNASDDDEKMQLLETRRDILHSNELIAVSQDFGTATLLSVRNAFKKPFYIAWYTIFVLAACFHAFNGFWTFLISWGWVLKMAAQRAWATVSVAMMLIMIFLGLAAVWGTYFLRI